VDTGDEITLLFADSTAVYRGNSYSFDPVGKPAQELIIAGGLEKWVKKNMNY
jgi:hypothetical protein